MIFLLVLLALFILYSFFFDKNNKSSYKKAAPKSRILIRQAGTAPTGVLRVIETAPGQTANRRTSEGMRPNLRLVMSPTHQNEKK
nr:hypothetical protein [Bacillus licheniformis]